MLADGGERGEQRQPVEQPAPSARPRPPPTSARRTRGGRGRAGRASAPAGRPRGGLLAPHRVADPHPRPADPEHRAVAGHQRRADRRAARGTPRCPTERGLPEPRRAPRRPSRTAGSASTGSAASVASTTIDATADPDPGQRRRPRRPGRASGTAARRPPRRRPGTTRPNAPDASCDVTTGHHERASTASRCSSHMPAQLAPARRSSPRTSTARCRRPAATRRARRAPPAPRRRGRAPQMHAARGSAPTIAAEPPIGIRAAWANASP